MPLTSTPLAPGETILTGEGGLSIEQEAMLAALPRHKIDLADRVLVVNPGGYLGESTRSEIDYARTSGKPVSSPSLSRRRRTAPLCVGRLWLRCERDRTVVPTCPVRGRSGVRWPATRREDSSKRTQARG